MILNSGVSADWTVAIGLYNMLQKTLINNYFALFCAGGVLVSIPISILFVIMQKFYVEGNKQDAVHDGQQDEPVGGVLLGGNGLCACSLAIGAGGGQSALPVGAGNVLLDTKIENYLSNFEKDFAFGSPQTVTPVPHPAPSSR